MAGESASSSHPLPKKIKRRILIFAGATGGHLFPAISFAEEYRLYNSDAQILLVSSRRAEQFIQNRWDSVFNEVQYWDSFPFSGLLSWATLRSLGLMLLAFVRTFRLLIGFKPHVSIGFGSYISFPGIFLSRLFGIPSVIHEQNRTLGKATQFLTPFAGLKLSSFPQTFSSSGDGEKTVGLPLRRTMIPQKSLGGNTEKTNSVFHLLVLGGSQGSHRLNQLMIEVFSEFSDEEKSRLVVNHITGKQDAERVNEAYKKMKISAQTFAFFDRMEDLYTSAQFAITRAGANTLFELAFFGLPALVVPYPYAGHHQKDNADFFAAQKACVTKVEFELTADWIRNLVRDLLKNPAQLQVMRASMKKLSRPHAGQDMVVAVEKYLETCQS